MIGRRRFLALAAAGAVLPGMGLAPARWRGVAMGADCAITLHGEPRRAAAALDRAVAALRRVEQVFSLHDPGSSLSRLNRDGALDDPPADLVAVLRRAGEAWRASGGRFDPTVQPLWRAYAAGDERDVVRAMGLVGWDGVSVSDRRVTLAPGQALTLNGIAQGWAADRVAEALAAEGFARALIDAGEVRALGGPWRIGVEDTAEGLMGWRTATGGAIATSSPRAMRLGAGHRGHVVDGLTGTARPIWSTVTVEADAAVVADAASTALCTFTRDRVAEVAARMPGVRRVSVVSLAGDLWTEFEA